MNAEALNNPYIKLEFQVAIFELLTQIKLHTFYENIVSYRYKTVQENCVWTELLPKLNSPLLSIVGKNDWNVNYEWYSSQNDLILHCAPLSDNYEVKGGFALRALHHLIYLHTFPENEAKERKVLSKYCRNAFTAGIYNVLLILPDLGSKRRYFQCRPYPEGAEDAYRSKQLIYGDRYSKPFDEALFSDMHGAIIWTQPDQASPRVMLERDSDDPVHMVGDVGIVIRLFAERHNATLRYRWKNTFRKIFPLKSIAKGVANGSIDIGAALLTVSSPLAITLSSYPYDIDTFCWMIPMPSAMPLRFVPFSIVKIRVLLIITIYMSIFCCLLSYSITGPMQRKLAFCNQLVFFEMVRAMLAQSFGMVSRSRLVTKFLYFMISFFCYIVASMYQAFLQSFLTQPPLLPAVRNLDDAYKSGLKMLYPTVEQSHVKEYQQLFGKLFVLTESSLFDLRRNEMDKQYIYPVSRIRWELFAEQQKFFKTRIFFYTESSCIFQYVPQALPIRPGLPYREVLNQFILRVESVGIVEHWHSLSFYEMRRLGLMTSEDLSSTEAMGEAIKLDDIYWILIGYICLIAIAIVEFVGEIVFYNYKIKKMFVSS